MSMSALTHNFSFSQTLSQIKLPKFFQKGPWVFLPPLNTVGLTVIHLGPYVDRTGQSSPGYQGRCIPCTCYCLISVNRELSTLKSESPIPHL